MEQIAYHSGTLVDDKYYIIGGNDKYIRQSPFIFIYDLKNNELEKIEIEKNERVCYLSMHSADYYERNKEIILFGGYSEGEMLNTVYKFNIERKEITTIESDAVMLEEGGTAEGVGEENYDPSNSPLPRTGHASFIYNNFLYIFGGSIEDGSLLNDLWKLDLDSKIWTKIENAENKQNIDDPELLLPSPVRVIP